MAIFCPIYKSLFYRSECELSMFTAALISYALVEVNGQWRHSHPPVWQSRLKSYHTHNQMRINNKIWLISLHISYIYKVYFSPTVKDVSYLYIKNMSTYCVVYYTKTRFPLLWWHNVPCISRLFPGKSNEISSQFDFQSVFVLIM